ncbi:hypothetical protein FA09DRAFT_340056 [Tilletiopsis washingtonensis]|uniref:Uncharacterized protein n=1 Tax=Tilletiopsis washingtonensis TaxID=58919 RepID=A0A316Z6V8_9BASI|nr:hypothetical protein FA09DRAFT_340056 [Tilletiopsis washingtonensis]PWN96698.1 hypothetical protein FA09DRAFT_340056 [Tilletiopsis washingtonensis]
MSSSMHRPLPASSRSSHTTLTPPTPQHQALSASPARAPCARRRRSARRERRRPFEARTAALDRPAQVLVVPSTALTICCLVVGGPLTCVDVHHLVAAAPVAWLSCLSSVFTVHIRGASSADCVTSTPWLAFDNLHSRERASRTPGSTFSYVVTV